MQQSEFNDGVLEFLRESPTPFHATMKLSQRLEEAGFIRLDEASSWSLSAGNRYYLTRNDSSVIAFIYGEENICETGIAMVGAHTDSPCLKLKPNALTYKKSYIQLGVEVYGGALLHPWFDRDLSLAGRVSGLNEKGDLVHSLIDFKSAIATIPSLAIHLDRDANTAHSINAQTDIPPIVMQSEEGCSFEQILCKESGLKEVLDFELLFYDTQPPAFIGLNREFLASARLDNLLSCYVGLSAITQASTRKSALLICSDHEEVGSNSASGAAGPFLETFLKRVLPDHEAYARMIDASMMISADNAHGLHPNFEAKHDENHGPILNQGPVIKLNANQRYASNSQTVSMFKLLCKQSGVPYQSFVTRTDMGCGSTIGPITATRIGVKTLDVGLPTFAMHSIRELAGDKDAHMLYRVLKHYFF
ncbi:MAG: M18 family aminopeptidase [Campylobacterales bacterium]|nr:M18 family aminopeptidase [Campylobacterales bacterium]